MARRFASIRRSTAGSIEIGAIVALTIGVWLLALGWNWSTSSEAHGHGAVVQSPAAWLSLAIVAVAAIGWLALRGRAVLGFVAVCVPIVVLSGWRLVAGDVLNWPNQVAALVFGLSVTGMPVALLGWWLRRRLHPVNLEPDDVVEPDDTVDGGAAEPADD